MANEIQIPEEKHALFAWSLLVILVLIALLFVIFPLLQYSSEQDDLISKRYKQLSSYKKVANSTPEFQREYKRVQKTGLDKLFYPQGLTAAQVGKELQKQLATVITRDDGVLVRSEVLDSNVGDEEQNSVYQQVAVKASLQGDSKLLRNLLHQAYRARPLIFVESLTVKPLTKEKSKQQRIKAEVVISTYWRGGVNKNESID